MDLYLFTYELQSIAFLVRQIPFFAFHFVPYCRLFLSLPAYKEQALQYIFAFGLVVTC